MDAIPCSSELEKLVSLTTMDDLWADYLAAVGELREATQWVSYGGREPLYEYLKTVHRLFENLQTRITEEIPKRLREAATHRRDPSHRGATWTYLSTDRPFGSLGERFLAGLLRKAKGRRFWG
jgi:preprotein translocase subunit SecA